MDPRVTSALRRLRQERGLSLKEVGARLGVHFTTVSSWERGRSEPPYETLGRLAALLGVSVAGLLGEEGPTAGGEGRPFRALSAAAAESVVRSLEELRLAACLAQEMAHAGATEKLAERTGIPQGRLATLAAGETTLRPAETAALVRHLGSDEVVATLQAQGAGGDDEGVPERLGRQIDAYLDRLRAYLTGGSGRSHQ